MSERTENLAVMANAGSAEEATLDHTRFSAIEHLIGGFQKHPFSPGRRAGDSTIGCGRTGTTKSRKRAAVGEASGSNVAFAERRMWQVLREQPSNERANGTGRKNAL